MHFATSDNLYRRTNENTKVMSNSASSTFQELYSHLASTNDQDIFIKPLSVEKAAQGDSFEIAKVSLMEVRSERSAM